MRLASVNHNINVKCLWEFYYVNCFVSANFSEELGPCSPCSSRKKRGKATFGNPCIPRTWSCPQMRNCSKCCWCNIRRKTAFRLDCLLRHHLLPGQQLSCRRWWHWASPECREQRPSPCAPHRNKKPTQAVGAEKEAKIKVNSQMATAANRKNKSCLSSTMRNTAHLLYLRFL